MTSEATVSKSTVGSFIANLPELLGALGRDARCVAIICEFDDGRYVQFWIDPAGSITAEVVSNSNIFEAAVLDDADEESLRSLGWSEPSPKSRPNWFIDVDAAFGLVRISRIVARSVYLVLGERPSNGVRFRTFAMERTLTGRRSVGARSSTYRSDDLSEMVGFLS